jgi:hypothetical protein
VESVDHHQQVVQKVFEKLFRYLNYQLDDDIVDLMGEHHYHQ